MHDDSIRAVWECELDRLELDVIRAERLLKGLVTLPSEKWDPPEVPGQMPTDLALRAQQLLDRQQRATAELGSALAAAQKQIAYGGRLADATGSVPARPVYLDLEA
jgi:multidrug efflux pump subunit AcrA (membrane-fusion protein)